MTVERRCELLAVVAIPVRNERDRITACLDALIHQIGIPIGSYGIIFFLNNCTDNTDAIVAGVARSSPCSIRVVARDHPDATAGWARRCAMDAASQWLQLDGAADGIILTTDADSRVGPGWVNDNIACIMAGADAVAGRIILDSTDADELPAALHARGRLEARYEALLTEIGARLDPEPWNPWPCHWTKSGASLAVRRSVYDRVGGMPALRVGEDRAFVGLLRSHDARVRHEPTIVVTTSGRLDGRAPDGVADTIRLRCNDLNSFCDERLEPLHRAITRVLWRRHLKNLHETGRLAETARWSSRLRLTSEQAQRCAAHSAFSIAFESIETISPKLAFAPLRPRELPAQIAIARIACWVIRSIDWLQRTGHRSDRARQVAVERPSGVETNGL